MLLLLLFSFLVALVAGDGACDLTRGSERELRINLDSDVDGIDDPHMGGLTHVGPYRDERSK